MRRVFQYAKALPARGMIFALIVTLLVPALLWAAPAVATRRPAPRAAGKQGAKAANEAGCRNGWRRVGTVKDPTLKRSWAVVASCAHPAWPARLEPAGRWKALPQWIPAGRRVTVTAPEGVTSMRLDGKTLTPGRVGQTVGVRLIDGVCVRAKLMAADRAEMEAVLRWRGR